MTSRAVRVPAGDARCINLLDGCHPAAADFRNIRARQAQVPPVQRHLPFAYDPYHFGLVIDHQYALHLMPEHEARDFPQARVLLNDYGWTHHFRNPQHRAG